MTNPMGYVFISSRSAKLPGVLRLRRKLEEHGIPVWHDKDSMPLGMLEKGMTEAIRNENCAGAVMWLSKDITDSAAIQRIEHPEILHRIRRDDGFIVVFCLDDNLSFDDAQSVLSKTHFNINLRSFFLSPVGEADQEDNNMKALTQLMLEKRIQLIHSRLAETEPLKIYVAGHSAPPATQDYALVIDHHRLFNGRFTDNETWKSKILPAFDLIGDSIVRYAPGRTVIAEGTPQLSLALAFGYALRTTRGLRVNWLQAYPDSSSQLWGIESLSASKDFDIKRSTDLLHGQDVAVLIGVTHDPKPTFDASAEELPDFGATIQVMPRDQKYPSKITDGVEAFSMTAAIIQEIRGTFQEFRLQGSIHLFIAGPVGLAFLLGRQLNTFGEVHCYEHVAEGPIGIYRNNLVMST